MSDKQLQSLLQSIDQPISDDGFTELLMERLPAKSQWRWQKHALLVGYLLACLLVLALFPLSSLGMVLSSATSAPLPFVLTAATLAVVSWRLGFEFAER